MTQEQWIEQAARIIQPITFRSYDDLVAYCLRNGDGIETATRYADRTYGDDMVNARAKAAALYPLVQQAVAVERERCAKVAENWPDRMEGAGIAHAIRQMKETAPE